MASMYGTNQNQFVRHHGLIGGRLEIINKTGRPTPKSKTLSQLRHTKFEFFGYRDNDSRCWLKRPFTTAPNITSPPNFSAIPTPTLTCMITPKH